MSSLFLVSIYTCITLILITGMFSRNCLAANQRTQETHYKAAVVEYQPEGTPWENTGPEIISTNLANYLNYIGNASANDADIIVFPEYGLTTLGIPRDRDAAKPFLLWVPEVGRNPCDEQMGSSATQILSCAAKAFNIYVVVNLGEIRNCTGDPGCPSEDNVFQFNTNVAFDRSGNIVAKYEKANLYFEDQFNKPFPVQLSTFETDFGVKFGLFTCFDIIFYDPAAALVEQGITHYIFPTAWVDELPFLTAIQAQASWAHGANANLLASGYHQPLGGQLGSGIYSGVNGAVVYTFDSDSGSVMLIAELPIVVPAALKLPYDNPSPTLHKSTSNVAAYHSFLREDLQNYTTSILNFALDQEVICTENGFCCQVHYTMVNESGPISLENYRLIAFNGTRTVAAKTATYDWQVCAVVRCLNYTLESCSENDKESSQIQLPNFARFELQSAFDVKQGTKFLPTFNTLDVRFDLISPSLFSIEYRYDESSAADGVMQMSSNLLGGIPIKSVAFINKLFETDE